MRLLIFMIAPPFSKEATQHMARFAFPSEISWAAKNLNYANFIPENFSNAARPLDQKSPMISYTYTYSNHNSHV